MSAAATNANASVNDGLDLSNCLVGFASSCSTLSWQGWHILSGVTAKAWHLAALCPSVSDGQRHFITYSQSLLSGLNGKPRRRDKHRGSPSCGATSPRREHITTSPMPVYLARHCATQKPCVADSRDATRATSSSSIEECQAHSGC